MPSRVVRQPNGLLAEFSTVVDDFTVVNATEKEMLKRWIDKVGIEGGTEKVARGVKDDMLGLGQSTAEDRLNRWRDALETIRLIHGEERVEKRIRECSAD